MRVFVAGGSGFLGKNFILRAPKDWEIFATYHTAKDFPQFLKERRINNTKAMQLDMRDPVAVKNMFSGIPPAYDVCLYVMGNSDIGLARREPLTDVYANIHPLLNLLSTIRAAKFIFMSSGSVYEGHKGLTDPAMPVSPIIPYSVDKLSSELFIKYYRYNTDRVGSYVNLRFFGAYGPMEPARKIYTNMIRAFAMDKKEAYRITGNGKNLIDAMYVEDAVDALLKIATSGSADLTCDLCFGRPLTINELVMETGRIFGRKVALTHEGDTPEYTTFYASPKAMERIFNFKPRVGLKEGMDRFAEYLYSGAGSKA